MATVAKISREEIAAEIKLKVDKDPEVDEKTKAFAIEVRDYWRYTAWPQSTGNHGPGVHPYDTHAYQESIQVKQNRDTSGRFAAGYSVFSDSPHANFIEYGTGPDKPGSRSPWGPNTPTPAFHPAAKTAIFYGGTAP